MTSHAMKLDTIYFDAILNKKKIYEVRVNDAKRQKIKLLDTITFSDNSSDRQFKCRIIELSFFNNFKDAIIASGLKKVLPNTHSINNGITLYESFPHSEGSYKLGAKRFGVLRLKFELL